MLNPIVLRLTVATLALAQVAPAFAQSTTRESRLPQTRPVTQPAVQPTAPANSNNWGGNSSWGSSNPDSWAGGYRKLTCESKDNAEKRCSADTAGRAAVLKTLSSTPCQQGRSWRFDSSAIYVSRGCRAEFAYGYSGSSSNKDDKNNTAAIVGGSVAAAGLVALLASSSKKSSKPDDKATTTTTQPTAPAEPVSPYPPQPPAPVSGDINQLPADAREPMRQCLNEAGRQVGVTGGTAVIYKSASEVTPGNGGYRFRAKIGATYPDGPRTFGIYCRATPTSVVELKFEPA